MNKYYIDIKLSKTKRLEVEAENKKEAIEMVKNMAERTNIFILNMPVVSRSYAICQIKKIRTKR